jgi:RNA polymerase sigma-54 factor
MKMSMSGQMRLEQRMKLAPRMIQSMEVLQLPLLALQEKIEAELNSNPVLELTEDRPEDGQQPEPADDGDPIEQKELVVNEDSNNAEDFQRLDSIAESFDDYFDQSTSFRQKPNAEASDRKLAALQNTAASELSLNDRLIDQWSLIETDEKVKKAGALIIDYLDEKGFLTVRIEQLHDEKKYGFGMDDLQRALALVQKLEPTGVGARDVQECLLIQMVQLPGDMSFEMELVEDHFQDLLENRFPQIVKKMNCTMEQINKAVQNLSKLDT